MKIQMDTKEKTIALEESINLNELIDILNSLFQNEEWKKWTLNTKVIIQNRSNPIIIDKSTPVKYPWDQPQISYENMNATNTGNLNQLNLKSESIFCIDLKK